MSNQFRNYCQGHENAAAALQSIDADLIDEVLRLLSRAMHLLELRAHDGTAHTRGDDSAHLNKLKLQYAQQLSRIGARLFNRARSLAFLRNVVTHNDNSFRFDDAKIAFEDALALVPPATSDAVTLLMHLSTLLVRKYSRSHRMLKLLPSFCLINFNTTACHASH